MLIGVLALQGAFREHKQMLEKCGCEVVEVRKNIHLEKLDGLIIPGGESTTIGKLLEDWDLFQPIKERGLNGMPIFGTCAGMIILAKNIVDSDQKRLGLMDVEVVRNAYGRQVDSFEADLEISVLGEKPFRGIFIRAPYIKSVEPQVGIMAEHDGKIVMVRQGNFLSCAFHPELTDDDRVHRYFLQMVNDAKNYN
ncbi:MAG: pyridoxal 5-phosphate synthase pdxT subunit [Clostridia bacterium]|jgi:5'-phosphate synthase pdxT subunit|nr:Glutamine amidotransferase subunit pdxT [Clostridiales bacterium]MDK2984361.1 pyridoxal 5-phosphate synthase pdxT subunit [Clostridia bacterium]